MNNFKLPLFLEELLNKQYIEEDVKKIIEGYSVKRYTTIRVNTLKTTMEVVCKYFDDNKIKYEKVDLLPDALVLKELSSKEVMQLELCQMGAIYLQSLSSQLPAYLLNPKKNKDILDMCAAPGSKTTYLASLTENSAFITACEVNKIRMERLKFNVSKLGANNINFMLVDSKKLDDYFRFDQILLDAPCSGSGVLSFNDESFKKFSKELVYNSSSLQLSLLKKALTILKPGCEMIYSTCSILDIENEKVVLKAITKTNCEIIPFDDIFYQQLPLLKTTIKESLCIMPNKYYEGFYVIKIRKNK